MQNLLNVNSNAQETNYQTKISELEAYELYDDMLNECHPSLFGVNPSEILKQVDQIPYRCGFNDYSDVLSEDYDLSNWY